MTSGGDPFGLTNEASAPCEPTTAIVAKSALALRLIHRSRVVMVAPAQPKGPLFPTKRKPEIVMNFAMGREIRAFRGGDVGASCRYPSCPT
jgi:hypothetical protein